MPTRVRIATAVAPNSSCQGRRGTLVLATAWLFCLAASGLAAAAEVLPQLIRGPYLQCGTPESMVIVWRADGPLEPRVYAAQTLEALAAQVAAAKPWPAAIVVKAADPRVSADSGLLLYREPAAESAQRGTSASDPSTPAGTWQYEATLSGLEPGTRYFYAIYDGARCLAGGDLQHSLRTSPVAQSGADLRLWVVGDSGTGGSDQKQVFQAMREFTQQTGRELDLYLHVGDMAYGDGTDPEFQRNFFDIYQPELCRTVCWPTMGNHEGHTSRGMTGIGPYYDAYVLPTQGEAGGLPSGTEAYYSFDVADVHFVCLDSHDLDRSPDAAMARWLQADLEHAQGKWMIAFWHHPPYTKGSHDSDVEGQLIEMRTHFMPLLESAGVDLVLSGHAHIYERSMLIDGAYETPTTAEGVVLDDGDGRLEGDGPYRKSGERRPHEGTVAIVSGHGGASLGRSGTMPVMREIIVEHGSLILDIQGDTLTGRMLNKHGELRDEFSIVKQGEVTPVRVANPRLPVHDPAEITEQTIVWTEDQAGQAPPQWSVVSGDAQRWKIEPVSAIRKLGVAQIEAAPEPFLAVYDSFRDELSELECWLEMGSSPDEHARAGVVLGFQDVENYFVYVLKPATREAELRQVVGGKQHVIDRRVVDIDFSQPIEVEMEPIEKLIEVQLNDGLEYTLNLEAPLPAGQIGLYVEPELQARFGLFEIERRIR
jgi:hypothetical protein